MVELFKGIKKVSERIEKQKSQIKRAIGVKEGPKPKIRSEHQFSSWGYYFICDICGIEYGPRNSHIPRADGGVKLMASFYMHCPECGRFICKPRCWNYIVGKCLSCAPSREIKMQQMRPKIRAEHKIPIWQYYFTCDICDKDYGPEKSMSKQLDGGFNLVQKHYRQCPNCGRFICRSQCWNYEKGTCTLCNALTIPEYIVKGEKLKNEYYLICSVCRNQLGPISEVDWKKIKMVAQGATKLALGVALAMQTGCTGSGTAVNGIYDMSIGIKRGTLPKKRTQEVATEAKTDLAQCPSCNRWVCIDDCWDKAIGVCKSCSKESVSPN